MSEFAAAYGESAELRNFLASPAVAGKEKHAIVEKLESSSGKFSTLLMGIIESPAFQQRLRSTP